MVSELQPFKISRFGRILLVCTNIGLIKFVVLRKGILDFFPFSVDNFLHHLALHGTSFVLGQQWDQEILKYKIRQIH